jgi:hypothetical protein
MSNLIFSNNDILIFELNIRYMFLFMKELSTLMMEFHSKNLYTCRDSIFLLYCIFLEIYNINIIYFLNYQIQHIP